MQKKGVVVSLNVVRRNFSYIMHFDIHGLRTPSTNVFFQYIPKVLADWAHKPNKLWEIFNIFDGIFRSHFVSVPPKSMILHKSAIFSNKKKISFSDTILKKCLFGYGL